jgi:menaquinone-9 beta-reductase
MYEIIITGGGLSGLTLAVQLAGAGLRVMVVEKQHYPFHRVCGEYVSNEVLPFLRSIGADPAELQPAAISKFVLTSPAGKQLSAPLDLGGFGISRFALDHYLYQVALSKGVTFRLQTSVTNIRFQNNTFDVSLSDGAMLQAPVAVGAYGKRANLDRQLNRPFFRQRSPYIGVKYHLHTDFPKDTIALHNFKNGYAGLSAIENDKYCFCYLTTRQNLKDHGSIPAMEKQLLSRNPHLKNIFRESTFLYNQPEVINEISFAPKSCLEGHLLLCGDAAGMITPLCGNGMAMAMHGAKILAGNIIRYFRNGPDRQLMEQTYQRQWNSLFAGRMQEGRIIQKLFGKPVVSELAVNLLKFSPAAVQLIMRRTHGKPF